MCVCVYVCMYVCMYACRSYLAIKSHVFCVVLYCKRWPVWFHHIFFKSSHNRKDFRKKLMNMKRVFRFRLPLLSETFRILRMIRRDTITNVHLCTGRPPTECDDPRCCIIQFDLLMMRTKVLET
jgi:hypothetical protein